MKEKELYRIGKIKKFFIGVLTMFAGMPSKCFAAIVQESSGGGNIQNSQLFQGFYNMAIDLTGTLQWIIPVVGLVFVAYYVFKIMTRRRTRSTAL